MSPTLIFIGISPWSERGRWVLEHHGIAYRAVEHVPMFGERRLRKMVGRREGKVTVPVLLGGGEVVTDSYEIAKWADRVGASSVLIPAALEPEIVRWNRVADEAMQRSRVLVAARMLRSPAALDETLPPQVPAFVRRMVRPVSRRVTEWFARKYALPAADEGQHLAGIREFLDVLRAGLAGGSYLLGEQFSYADIIGATVLQGVRPVDDAYLPLGPATRDVWTFAELAAEYDDLLRWRDDLYRRHRRRAS